MPKISEYYAVGRNEDMSPEDLLRVMQDMYRDLAIAINRKPDIIERNVDGDPANVFLSNGDIQINNDTEKVEMVVNHPTQTTVTWKTLS